jgi:transcriptional regulator with XRE-family HTH domain
MATEIPIGERVKFYRDSQHRSQVVVAGLAGITTDYLSQIERGLKTPTIGLLHRFGKILDVPVSVLLGESSAGKEEVVLVGMDQVYRAMMVPRAVYDEVDIVDLALRVQEAWRIWQNEPDRYTRSLANLPQLIIGVEGALQRVRTSTDVAQRQTANQAAADLNFLLRSLCKRAGRIDLSLVAADRGIRAAQEAEDPVRLAAAHWNLGHAQLADGAAEHALESALTAIELSRPLAEAGDADVIAVTGALHLVAAVAESRLRDGFWKARERLRQHALPAARIVPSPNIAWTAFNEDNVNLHAFNLELEHGESTQALRLADGLQADRYVSIERRLTHLLDLARCYDQRRDDAAVLLHLLEAERAAPEDLRYNVLARELVRSLLKRARPSLSAQVQRLADRMALFT